MISLGTHQAATWGYSTRPLPTFEGAVGSSGFIGLFTKPTLAPNGTMYAILGMPGLFISSVAQSFVILKIVPGNTNTATTNYTAPAYSYLIADNGFPANSNGFAKPSWGAILGTSGDNALFRFNTGILASNGLIYFPPVQCGSNNNYWVIFDPTTELWKVTNALRPSTLVGDLTNLNIGGAVLGTDNKIYVYATFGRGFRITTSTNASNDTVEDSYYAATAGVSSPLGNGTAPLLWRDEAAAVYTDVASTGGVAAAYNNSDSTIVNQNSARIFTTISDAIVHPTGRIYLMPGNGRGRIFYINQSAYGTSGELVSAPGLSTASIAGYGQRTIKIQSAFLEKPRDENHNPTTLKIFLVPTIGNVASPTVSSDILVIDPQAQTMSTLSMLYITPTSSSTSFTTLSKLINLPNGMTLTYNRLSNTGSERHGGMILTGFDVPASDTDGVRTITVPNKGIMQDQNVTTISVYNPSQTGIGGGTNGLWPHNGKFIGMFNPGFSTNSINLYEIVSVKGYHPGVTNFNFSSRDRLYYTIPSNLSQLGSSVYNCQFNKPK